MSRGWIAWFEEPLAMDSAVGRILSRRWARDCNEPSWARALQRAMLIVDRAE
jgi:hypothetical protein